MAQPVNVVLTAQVGDVYDAQGQPTGAKMPRVQRQTGHMVDIILHAKKQFDPIAKEWKYVSTLEKCRFQRGFSAEIEDVTYDKLVALLRDQLGVKIGE